MAHPDASAFEHPLGSHRGMNPDFVRRVHEKRLIQRQMAEKATREAARVAAKEFVPTEPEIKIVPVAPRIETNPVEIDASERTSAKDIILAVCDRYDVNYRLVTDSTRVHRIMFIRREAMMEVHLRKPKYSLPKIGGAFGNRDHTTVLHGLRKAGCYKAPISGEQADIEQVVALRATGAMWIDVAKAMGCSVMAAWRAVNSDEGGAL